MQELARQELLSLMRRSGQGLLERTARPRGAELRVEIEYKKIPCGSGARMFHVPAPGEQTTLAIIPLVVLMFCLGCSGGEPWESSPDSSATTGIVFTEVGEQAGLSFVHETGAFGRKYLPETMGSGCAWFDYDLDGRPDLFLVQSMNWPGHKRIDRPVQALYRNLGDGKFQDVTREAGLDLEVYGQGVAIGDYDNDGDPDLFLNALGPDHLFKNRGNGTFEEVTASAGVSDPGFGSSATFLDYDRDGWLDLFVCNYVEWSEDTDLFCTLDGVVKSYCTPQSYPGTVNRLYRNRGDGTFADVTRPSGIYNESGKSLGLVVYDHDQDDWPDVAVANDTVRNFLYRNNGDGSFNEIGQQVGLAFSESGEARAGMGIDAADYDGSGRESVVIGNFSAEMVALFHNRGIELYTDDAALSGVGTTSLLTLAFGTFFFDYDLDGWVDLFVANGHLEPEVARVQSQITYAQAPHLFHNLGDGTFEEVARHSGTELSQPAVARGAAYADYDADGDLDFVVSVNGGSPRLFRNDGGNRNNWLRLSLVGTDSARDALGARAVLTVGGRSLTRRVPGASSYLSQSESVLTFGLGQASEAERLDVFWPSGRRQSFTGLSANTIVRIVEGENSFRTEPTDSR
jgi:hypothetical protein